MLPSQVLAQTPGELYLDLILTYPPEGEQYPPRRREADDPTLTALLASLKAGRNGG